MNEVLAGGLPMCSKNGVNPNGMNPKPFWPILDV